MPPRPNRPPASGGPHRTTRKYAILLCLAVGTITVYFALGGSIPPSILIEDNHVGDSSPSPRTNRQVTVAAAVGGGKGPAALVGDHGKEEAGVSGGVENVAAGGVDAHTTPRFPIPTHNLLHPGLIELLNRPDVMPDLVSYHKYEDEQLQQTMKNNNQLQNSGDGDQYKSPYALPRECNTTELTTIKDSSSNLDFLRAFAFIFATEFKNIPWWLDEGGLIGSSRAGHMNNADDDFDFFALLPNQTAPCRPDSLSCERGKLGKGRNGSDGVDDEYKAFIHRFLMVFWTKGGMCINKFNPDVSKFESKGRLMFSFQLDPTGKRFDNPERCFKEGKPFAHMHLGMLMPHTSSTNDDDSKKNRINRYDESNSKSSINIGMVETNVWAKHTTHPVDELPLHLALPVRRCRAGHLSAPCPNSVVGFLSVRNRGEYVKGSSDGSCLLIRKKWDIKRREAAVRRVRALDECGYASMVALADPLVANDYQRC